MSNGDVLLLREAPIGAHEVSIRGAQTKPRFPAAKSWTGERAIAVYASFSLAW